ncbi:MAG: zinc ribbon domain-containing protein [Deltaproteobacteria bacterium]|jgi:uncharacterized OB-fold protein
MGENDSQTQAEELIALSVVNSIDYRFASGPIQGKFLAGLKEKKFLATKCPKCGRIQTPAREACAKCVVRTEELVEVGPKATVANYDIVYYASPDPLTGQLRSTPYASLFMWMDGATPDDCVSLGLKQADIPKLKRGLRVRPVWNEVRTGSVSDILYFEADE